MATINVATISGRPDHILRDLHGSVSRLLQKFADKGTIFEGLSIAGRRLQLTSKSKRRLRELDAVAAWLKHASDERNWIFMEELAQELRAKVGVARYSNISPSVASPMKKKVNSTDSDQGVSPHAVDDPGVCGLLAADPAGKDGLHPLEWHPLGQHPPGPLTTTGVEASAAWLVAWLALDTKKNKMHRPKDEPKDVHEGLKEEEATAPAVKPPASLKATGNHQRHRKLLLAPTTRPQMR